MLALLDSIIGHVDFVKIMWYAYTVIILAVGIPVLYWPARLPSLIKSIYLYGKLNEDSVKLGEEHALVRALRFKKSVFAHFYQFFCIYHLAIMAIICQSYYTRQSPAVVVILLDAVAGKDRQSVVPPSTVLVVGFLLLIQATRRLYECQFVCVYSDGKISLPHYGVAITFYLGTSISLIAWSPGFTKEGFKSDSFDDFQWKWHQLVGTVLYFWLSWHQHKATSILANLRKNGKGKKLTKEYKIPNGDWFEYVSCPHMLAEILIYSALNLILGFRNPLFVALLVFVICNQTMVALLNQQWYRKTFAAFPKDRKAIVPFLL